MALCAGDRHLEDVMADDAQEFLADLADKNS
jgi:hypothetical protein